MSDIVTETYCRVAAICYHSDAVESVFATYQGAKVEYRPPFQWEKGNSWNVKWYGIDVPGTLLGNMKENGVLVGDGEAWIENGKEAAPYVAAFTEYLNTQNAVFMRHSAYVTFCAPTITHPNGRDDIKERLLSLYDALPHLEKYKI